jgi:hypothetical protein
MTVEPVALWYLSSPGKLVANIPDDLAEEKARDEWGTVALKVAVGDAPDSGTELVGVLRINSMSMIVEYEGIEERRLTSFTDSL